MTQRACFPAKFLLVSSWCTSRFLITAVHRSIKMTWANQTTRPSNAKLYKHQEFPTSGFKAMHYGMDASSEHQLSNVRHYLIFVSASCLFTFYWSCLIPSSFIHILLILKKYIRLSFKWRFPGKFEGKKLHLKSWFQAKNFWQAAISSKESEVSLKDDEVNSWRSDALKLHSRRRGSNASGSKRELVARVFATSEMGIPV